jgi:hypothetical protein
MDKIKFILDNIPDLYNKEEGSNIYNLLNSIAVELDTFVSNLEEVRKAKFVDYAVQNDLDKIAAILNMKRFINENDDSFRGRIKSKVPSFIGGGAISALKQVVNNYLGVEPIIIEHYNTDEGHPYFDNGVINGLTITNSGGLVITIKSGVSYINGTRITSNDSNLTLSSNSTLYIKLNSNGTFSFDTSNTATSSQIIIASVVTTTSVGTITDMRLILNPEEHYITNTASITVQIPYNFTSSNIPLENVKDILRNTKAAGIALLIKIMETYNDYVEIADSVNSYFLVGFSGIGGNNILGGQ